MPRRSIELNKRSADELRRLQRDVHKFARRPEWERRIRRELDGPVRDAERAVKLKILSIPSKGGNARKGRESLRSKMLRAVKTNVDTTSQYTGAFIWVDAYAMPSGEENLPAYMERARRYGRWRKPVFGNREVWATQKAHPYFYRTLRPFENTTADVAEKVVGQMREELDK